MSEEILIPIPKRRTGRSEIMRILEENPEGLPSEAIRYLVSQNYATGAGVLQSVLCQLVKEGTLSNLGRRNCSCCHRSSAIYTISRNHKNRDAYDV